LPFSELLFVNVFLAKCYTNVIVFCFNLARVVRPRSLLTAVLFICPSVCLLHSWATHKWFATSKHILHDAIERYYEFLEAKFCGPEFRGSFRTSVLRPTPVESASFTYLLTW